MLVGIAALVLSGTTGNVSEERTRGLAALASSQSTSGTFFLGSGRFDGENHLSYIVKNENGSFTTDPVPGKHSEVFEDESDNPTITTHTLYADHPWLFPWRLKTGYWWEFHIPEGSIQTEFEVSP